MLKVEKKYHGPQTLPLMYNYHKLLHQVPDILEVCVCVGGGVRKSSIWGSQKQVEWFG